MPENNTKESTAPEAPTSEKKAGIGSRAMGGLNTLVNKATSGETTGRFVEAHRKAALETFRITLGTEILEMAYAFILNTFFTDEAKRERMMKPLIKGAAQFLIAHAVAQALWLVADTAERGRKIYEFCGDAVIYGCQSIALQAMNLRGFVSKILPFGSLQKLVGMMRDAGEELDVTEADFKAAAA